jgi:RNA polymerase sigma-70 factor, ECF subfamily
VEPGTPFSRTFLGALAGPLRERAAGWDDLDGRLGRLLAAARAAHPGLAVADEAFLAHLAARLPDDATADALDALRAADLYLACACLAGAGPALAAFEAHCMGEVDAALRRMNLSAGADDVKQTLRHELFLADADRRPKIASYDGAGDLRAWVRVTAVRLALKQLRKGRHETPVDDERLLDIPAGGEDADLAQLKESYRDTFKAAFADAFAGLPPRDQNLLRQQFLDGLSIDELGALYRVHRSTAARWLATARERLLDGTRERMMERVRVSAGECDSILRIVQSRLDLSISRLFRAGPSSGRPA